MRKLRMRRIINCATNKTIILPMDHGLTLGPIDGLCNIRETVGNLLETNLNAVILHKGNIKNCEDILARKADIGVIMHLSASVAFSPKAYEKVLIGSVEEGIRIGADALSMHINIGSDGDYNMISSLGVISEACDRWGMPLLAMMYPRGNGNEIDEFSDKYNSIAARVGMELGADIIKINYTGSLKSFERVMKGVNVPVIIAGGRRKDDVRELFQHVHDALAAGASGIAMGRNLFQYPDPKVLVKALDLLINEGITVTEACEFVSSKSIGGN